MKEIPLTKGYVALVDDEDYSKVSLYRWQALEKRRKDGTVYGVYARQTRRDGTKTIHRLLHRVLLDISDPAIQVDHHDGDGLNNQRDNLRVSTNQQNQSNRRKRTRTSSQYKGVSLHKPYGKWKSQISTDGEHRYLGLFESEIAAASRYDEAAREHFGVFACLNFPDQSLKEQSALLAAQ